VRVTKPTQKKKERKKEKNIYQTILYQHFKKIPKSNGRTYSGGETVSMIEMAEVRDRDCETAEVKDRDCETTRVRDRDCASETVRVREAVEVM
jgi:hypothetical protein